MTIEEILVQAAASSDQAVRGMAVRYKRLQAKLRDMEPFFDAYAAAVAEVEAEPQAAAIAAPKKANGAKRQPQPGVSIPQEDFLRLARETLAAHGSPLPLGEFYDRFCAHAVGHPLPKRESFRQRLLTLREHIPLNGHDYWLADAA